MRVCRAANEAKSKPISWRLLRRPPYGRLLVMTGRCPCEQSEAISQIQTWGLLRRPAAAGLLVMTGMEISHLYGIFNLILKEYYLL